MTVASSGTRTRAQHLGPERRRPQLLDAARSIAVEQGVAAVTISAVADRLGVTRPVIYSCFSDRVALIAALLEREEETLVGGAIAALPHDRADADEAVFIDGMRGLLETVARQPDSWKLVMDADPDPAVADLFRRGRFKIGDHFTWLLRPTLRSWGTVDADRKLPILVEQFLCACEGAVRSLLRDGGRHWSPASLGELVGAATYRALRSA